MVGSTVRETPENNKYSWLLILPEEQCVADTWRRNGELTTKSPTVLQRGDDFYNCLSTLTEEEYTYLY